MWRKAVKIILFFFIVFIEVTQVFGQTKTMIKVLDESSQPVPFANICLEKIGEKNKISYAVTNEKGEASTELSGAFRVAISCVGFGTLYDTITGGKNVTIHLQPSSTSIDEVVVTGQFSPQTVDKSIYKVNVISASTIEAKVATNLEELLSNEIGMNSTANSGVGKSIRIQGLGGEHVKILINGVPVIGRQSGIIDMDQINLTNVDHIETIEGPMSVMYGSNAMGGVINIITKNRFSEKFHSSLKSYYESVGVYNFNAVIGGGTEKHQLIFSGTRNFFGGYSEVDTSRSKELKPKLQYSSELSYNYRNNGLDIRVDGNYFNEELRDLGNPEQENNTAAIDAYYFTTRENSSISLSKEFDNQMSMDMIVAYSYYSKIKNTFYNDLTELRKNLVDDSTVQDTTTFKSFYSRGSINKKFNHIISAKVGYESTIDLVTGKRLSSEKRIDDYAGFLVLNTNFSDKLQFQPGVRFIYNSKFPAPIIYSLNFKSDLGESFDFRVSVSNGFRAPSSQELYLQFKDINHDVTGNENLKAETGNNYNLWVDFKKAISKNNFSIESNLYYKKINDAIELLFDPVLESKAQYFNLSDIQQKSTGMTLKSKYTLHPRFTMNLGYGLNGINKIDEADKYLWTSDYAAGFSYKNLKYRFELDFLYKYTDKYVRYTGIINYETFKPDSVVQNYLDGYHNMNFTITKTFFNNSIKISTGVKNIFNNTSIASSGSTGPHPATSGSGSGTEAINWGRTWFVKLNYQFSKF